MKKAATHLLAATASFAFTISASASVIFTDDFETGETVGSAPADSNWVPVQGGIIVRDSTTEAPFGAGNQYLEVEGRQSGGNGFSFARNESLTGNLATVSFDFSWDGDNTDSYMRWTLRGDNGTNNLRPLHRIDVGGGANDIAVVASGATGPQVNVDTPYRFDVVFNFTGSATAAYNGANTVAANSMDLWIDGVLVIDDEAFDRGNNANNTAFTDFGFWAQTGTDPTFGNFYFDNYQVEDMAVVTAIPEPSSFALIGLGVLGLLGRRKRSLK